MAQLLVITLQTLPSVTPSWQQGDYPRGAERCPGINPRQVPGSNRCARSKPRVAGLPLMTAEAAALAGSPRYCRSRQRNGAALEWLVSAKLAPTGHQPCSCSLVVAVALSMTICKDQA